MHGVYNGYILLIFIITQKYINYILKRDPCLKFVYLVIFVSILHKLANLWVIKNSVYFCVRNWNFLIYCYCVRSFQVPLLFQIFCVDEVIKLCVVQSMKARLLFFCSVNSFLLGYFVTIQWLSLVLQPYSLKSLIFCCDLPNKTVHTFKWQHTYNFYHCI